MANIDNIKDILFDCYNLQDIEKIAKQLTTLDKKYINYIIEYIYKNKYEVIFENIKISDDDGDSGSDSDSEESEKISFKEKLIKQYTPPSVKTGERKEVYEKIIDTYMNVVENNLIKEKYTKKDLNYITDNIDKIIDDSIEIMYKKNNKYIFTTIFMIISDIKDIADGDGYIWIDKRIDSILSKD